MSGEQYDADYFLRGKESGKSLYQDYRWLPDLTIPMVSAMIRHLGMKSDESVLDFGCARGYTVKAFRLLGYIAYGIDASEWAIRNGDEDVKQYLNWTNNGPPLVPNEFDWIIAKDVLEHVDNVREEVDKLMAAASVGVFAVVPLAHSDDSLSTYVVPEYEQDVTHIHRVTLGAWASMFLRPGWEVTASYRVGGIKDNYAKWERGNGFITARRLSV